METVAMDIIFTGKEAEKLRIQVKDIVCEFAFQHKLKANIEITSWNPTHDPIIIKNTMEG